MLNSEELELCAYIYMHLTLVPSKIFQGAAEGCGAVSRRSVQNLAVPREASSAAARGRAWPRKRDARKPLAFALETDRGER